MVKDLGVQGEDVFTIKILLDQSPARGTVRQDGDLIAPVVSRATSGVDTD